MSLSKAARSKMSLSKAALEPQNYAYCLASFQDEVKRFGLKTPECCGALTGDGNLVCPQRVSGGLRLRAKDRFPFGAASPLDVVVHVAASMDDGEHANDDATKLM